MISYCVASLRSIMINPIKSVLLTVIILRCDMEDYRIKPHDPDSFQIKRNQGGHGKTLRIPIAVVPQFQLNGLILSMQIPRLFYQVDIMYLALAKIMKLEIEQLIPA